MVFDYNALSTWRTPDLLSRDIRLVKRTRVMGMSEKAAILHIVALVCTAGTSLPINLAFCIWHAHRYGEVKKERTWIRQILGTRNMSYRGRGHWVEAQPTPNRMQKVQVQTNPSRVQTNPSRVQTVQPYPIRGQRVQVTRTPPAKNDPQMQYTQANANASVNNEPQSMQYTQANANASVNNDPKMQFVDVNTYASYASVNDSQQDFGNNTDIDLQMQFVEVNAYASVDDYEQDFGNNADDDLQMQFEQVVGNSAVNDLEQDFGNNDAMSEAIAPGLLELLAS